MGNTSRMKNHGEFEVSGAKVTSSDDTYSLVDIKAYKAEEDVIQELMSEESVSREEALTMIEQIRSWSKAPTA